MTSIARTDGVAQIGWPPKKLLPGISILVLFLIIPLSLLLMTSFWSASFTGLKAEWTLANYARLFSRPVYVDLLVKSTRIAFVVTTITLAVAFPMALWIANRPPARRTQLMFLILIPFWTSYVVRTYAWIPLLGNNGVINYALMKSGIVTAPLDIFLFNQFTVHVGLLYVYLPYAIIPIALSLERIDKDLIFAAADLGASPRQQLMRIIIPLALPGILGGGIMVFILCIGAYVTPALLGGTSGMMIANVIPDMFGVGMNWPLGSAASLLLMAITMAWVWLLGSRVGFRSIFIGD
jgi:spermidine/putrescine transport system permease protein